MTRNFLKLVRKVENAGCFIQKLVNGLIGQDFGEGWFEGGKIHRVGIEFVLEAVIQKREDRDDPQKDRGTNRDALS